MTDPGSSELELTQALLHGLSLDGGNSNHKTAAASDPGAMLANADVALHRLQLHLLGWFGPDGLDALLTRALERARISHPVLACVTRPENGTLCLADLSAGVGDASTVGNPDSDEMLQGVMALLATILTLIGRLIGEDMMGHLVQQICPELPDKSSPANGGGNNKEVSGT